MPRAKRKKVPRASGIEKKAPIKKNIGKEYTKILKGFLIVMILILVAIFLISFFSNRAANFDYHGVKFQVVKFCDQGPCLTTYNTKIPVTYQGGLANYNFYLYNDPRELEQRVPFNGTLNMKKLLVMNITFDKSCKGNESVAVSNFATLYGLAGTKINANSTVGCDLQGNYMYITLRSSDKTSIEQTGSACYNINIKNCEILDGMERFMTETFVKINENLKNIKS